MGCAVGLRSKQRGVNWCYAVIGLFLAAKLMMSLGRPVRDYACQGVHHHGVTIGLFRALEILMMISYLGMKRS